ncbi:MAG: LysR family transcriptional regulator [Oscillospiraceae bacterium]|nr:LysR family transcriptional regulator [Oscillospiraceae bacterium]
MTNGQINCFITVVEEKSFAKAANSLFISQPAISKSISKLEEELGFVLLERRSGSLRLTPAGSALYDFLKKSSEEYTQLLANIHSNLEEPFGSVKIGCPETWNPNKFYGKIKAYFDEYYPAVKLDIECFRLPELLSRLQSGKLDIIMTHDFYPPVQYGLEVKHIADTGCGVLCAKAWFEHVESIYDLDGVDFLTYDVDLDKKFGQTIRKICMEYGIAANLRNCGQYSNALFEMSCGKGVMFFTEWDNVVSNTEYKYLPLNNTFPTNIIYPSVTSNANTHIIADELIKLFSDNPDTDGE